MVPAILVTLPTYSSRHWTLLAGQPAVSPAPAILVHIHTCVRECVGVAKDFVSF